MTPRSGVLDPNRVGSVGLDIAFAVVIALILLAITVHFACRLRDRRAGIGHEGGPYASAEPPPIDYQRRDQSGGG
jgi:hypothetical protein